ncbi:MAG: 4Fe-4S dicluster domain-containing protein [Wenzhouxiangella sp.]
MKQTTSACIATLQASGADSSASSAVRYSASGHLLVVHPSARQLEQLRHSAWPGTMTICLEPDATDLGTEVADDFRLRAARVVELQGWLGRFQVRAVDPSDQPVSGLSSKGSGHFDLVIDCSSTALLEQRVPPFGYFRRQPDQDLGPTLEDAAALIGNFFKPRYFHYQAEICAHHSYGQSGCTRCLDVCGAAAIQSSGQKIEVNPYLCQGCGSCTLACPTGALSFIEPQRDALLAALRQQVADSGDQPGPLLVSNQAPSAAGAPAPHLVVEPLSAFGEELWIAALALGYSQVILQANRPLEALSRTLLAAKLADMQRMLPALGLANSAVVLIESTQAVPELPARTGDARQTRAGFEAALQSAGPAQTKRELLNLGLEALAGERGPQTAVGLAGGAALGEIRVDLQRCTLCSSCAKLCPTGAIDYSEREQAGTARLSFLEALCVQCGVCANGCPEQAIELAPRLGPDEIRRQRRIVASSPMAECTDCGAQFVGEKLLKRTLERLAEHGATEAALEQAVRCPRCRAMRVG